MYVLRWPHDRHRASRAAASRNTGPHRYREKSGSTPHDVVTARLINGRPDTRHSCWFIAGSDRTRFSPWIRPQRRPQPDRPSALHTFPPTRTRVLRAKPSASAAVLHPQQAQTRGKIPMAPAAPPPHISRDFVPWRFLDACPRSAWVGRHPGVQKPAQKLPFA
jgi:hypothetical protein